MEQVLTCLTSSIWAAVTKYHELGGLYITETDFSHFWRLGDSKVVLSVDWMSGEVSFLDEPSFCYNLTEQKGQRVSLGPLLEGH